MSASRSRQKRKLEPISIEELAGTTGMSGFCSFLTRDGSVAVPVLDHLQTGAPDNRAPVTRAVQADAPDAGAAVIGPAETTASIGGAAKLLGAETSALDSRWGVVDQVTAAQSSAPVESPPEAAAPVMGAGETPAVEAGAPETSAPETSDFRYRRRPRVREARTVEDGHSLAEQAVYDAMFRAGKPYRGDSRILTIGLRTLAELSRMAYSNCKANVRSLVSKLALEELPGFSYTDGRTYIIHSYPEILRRRRDAGLTHVLRTRGVAFVEPQSGAPQPAAPESGAPDSTPLEVLAALRHHHPDLDSASAAVLWIRCRKSGPQQRPRMSRA